MSPPISIGSHTWYVAIPLQAGLTEKGKMYVMVGENRVTPVAVKEFTLADLKAFPVSDLPNVSSHGFGLHANCPTVCIAFYMKDGTVVLLEKKGESGWVNKCSLVKSGGILQGISLHGLLLIMYVQQKFCVHQRIREFFKCSWKCMKY